VTASLTPTTMISLGLRSSTATAANLLLLLLPLELTKHFFWGLRRATAAANYLLLLLHLLYYCYCWPWSLPSTILPAGSDTSGSTVLSPRVRSPAGLKAVAQIPMSRYTYRRAGRETKVRHCIQKPTHLCSTDPEIIDYLLEQGKCAGVASLLCT
jgi:hypothetical protein